LEKLAPAIIAVLIAVYIAFESPLSGMSLNPARSFGSALTAGQYKGLWLYFVAPVLAMLLATEVYRARVASGWSPPTTSPAPITPSSDHEPRTRGSEHG
jgi:aquaporin Z